MSPTASGRRAALVTREEAHRRTLLLSIGTLLLFSVSPLFGHHFAEGLEHGLRGQNHLGVLCLTRCTRCCAPCTCSSTSSSSSA